MKSTPTVPDDSARGRQNSRELFRRICKARDTDGAEPLGELFEKFRESLKLSRIEFIERIRVSRSTYQRWLKGEKPPVHRIDKLQLFLEEETPEERARDSIISGDRRLTLRPFEQVLDRQIRCKSCWVIKNALPYKAAVSGKIMNTLFNFLKDDSNMGAFHCVFFAPDEEGMEAISPYAARESFVEFKQKLYRFDKTAATKLRGWQVTSEALAFKLGLSNNYFGICILEYDSQKTVGIPNLENKEVDILIEVPMAIYQDYDHQQLKSGNESRWLELAPEIADLDWQAKKGLLYKLADGGFSSEDGVKELLTTPDEILASKRKVYLPL